MKRVFQVSEITQVCKDIKSILEQCKNHEDLCRPGRGSTGKSSSGGAYESASDHRTVILNFPKSRQIGALGKPIGFQITFYGNSSIRKGINKGINKLVDVTEKFVQSDMRKQ